MQCSVYSNPLLPSAGTVTVDCTTGTPFSLTSAPEAEVPEFTLSCTSSGGPVRGFSCTGPGGTIAGVASLRTPADEDVRDNGRYDHSATMNVTENYPGVYTCQVTVYRYDGTGDEPEILVYPETPGAAQTITVPTVPGELVNISLSITPDHYPSLSQLLPLPLDCQPHKSVPP